LFFLSYINSQNQHLSRKQITLQEEFLPRFVTNDFSTFPKKSTIKCPSSGKCNLHYEFPSNVETLSQSDWATKRYFSRCTIYAYNSMFTACTAFGFDSSLNMGGAFYADLSQVRITGAKFEKNEALIGGSIAVTNTNILIEANSTFSHDRAYQMGGSLLVATEHLGVDKVKDDFTLSSTGYSFHVYGATFTECSADEFHGAVSSINTTDLYFSYVKFIQCKAGHSGGAMGIVNTFASLSYCVFDSCYAGLRPMQEHSKFSNKNVQKIGIPKGGGAIIIETNLFDVKYYNSPHHIDTISEKCCFKGNYVYDMLHVNTHGNMGMDILLAGKAFYRSYFDSHNLPENDAVAIADEHLENIVKCPTGDPAYQINCLAVFTYYNYTTDDDNCKDNSQPIPIPTIVPEPEPTFTLYTDPETITTINERTPTKPPTHVPEATTRAVPTTPPTTHKTLITLNTFQQIRSPTASMSQSPTCSTFGEKPPSGKVRTLSSTYIPPFEWDPTATPMPTETGIFTWPAQTPSPTKPTQSNYFELPDPTPIPPTPSWWGEIPHPTPTASISFEGEPDPTARLDLTPTASRSAPPEGQTPIGFTVEEVSTITQTMTLSKTEREIIIPTVSKSQTQTEGGQIIEIDVTTDFTTVATVEVFSAVDVMIKITQMAAIYTDINNTTQEKKKFPLALVVGIGAAAVVIAIVAAVLIHRYFPKKAISAGVEMKPEVVGGADGANGATVTADNPLWSANIAEDTDDPFKEDFEEDANKLVSSTTNF